jgi:chaperone BCS1
MTSNFPERLDKALIRPGRIDINLNLDWCTDVMVEEMFNGFFGTEHGPPLMLCDFKNIKQKKFTPAKIQEILCNNFDNPENAYKIIQGI